MKDFNFTLLWSLIVCFGSLFLAKAPYDCGLLLGFAATFSAGWFFPNMRYLPLWSKASIFLCLVGGFFLGYRQSIWDVIAILATIVVSVGFPLGLFFGRGHHEKSLKNPFHHD